ncbi:hypothetical protein [Pseudolysinimonas sp.]|jgi:hypothetical protein|uniref:hypothetical protein n=1 Tax=Pseudolysinimonas sp. TaxID=2680009 RepID=UPI003784C041
MARAQDPLPDKNSDETSQWESAVTLERAIRKALEASESLREQERREQKREEAMRLRIIWRDSAEYKRMTRWQIGVFVPVGLAVAVLGILAGQFQWIFPDDESMLSQERWRWPVIAATWVFVYLYGGMAVWAYRQGRQRQFAARQRLGLATELEEQEREIAESGQELDLASLWAITQKRIEYYHQIAIGQSESSFRNGTIAGFAGFVLLLIVGVVGAFTTSLNASIAVGAVGAAGAAMTAYLGSTFMKTQAASTEQLRQFFVQPVEFSRVLAAERLIESLPESDRAYAVKLVLASMLAIGDQKRDATA